MNKYSVTRHSIFNMNIVHKSVEYKSQFLEVGDIAPFLQDLVNLVPRIHPRFRHVDLDLELVVDGGDDDLDFVVDVRVAPPVEQYAPVKKIAVSDRVLHLHMTTFFFIFIIFAEVYPREHLNSFHNVSQMESV